MILFVGRASFLIYYIIFMGRKPVHDHIGDKFGNHLKEVHSKMGMMAKYIFPMYQMLFPITVYIIYT